jgi:hypothetical protein
MTIVARKERIGGVVDGGRLDSVAVRAPSFSPRVEQVWRNADETAYDVDSSTVPGKTYRVMVADVLAVGCTCPHYQVRGFRCKHMDAVIAFRRSAQPVNVPVADGEATQFRVIGADHRMGFEALLNGHSAEGYEIVDQFVGVVDGKLRYEAVMARKGGAR